jgi:hypothetical protein
MYADIVHRRPPMAPVRIISQEQSDQLSRRSAFRGFILLIRQQETIQSTLADRIALNVVCHRMVVLSG